MSRIRYQVAFVAAALAWLRKAPKDVREQIGFDIYRLQCDPEQPGVKALRTDHDPPLMRLRSGDYRIVYFIEDDILVITVVGIADRKEIYKRLKRRG